MVYRLVLTFGLIAITLLLLLTYLQQKEQLRIQKEQHILSLYSSYKNNIDTCTSLATQAGKDMQFIKDNCINEINSSLVGKALTEWGQSNLLIK